MKLHRNVYIVGGAHTPFIGKGHPDFIWKHHPEFGQRDNPTIEQYITTVVRSALSATGVAAEAIERGYLGNFLGELFSKQGLLGASIVSADPALDGKPFFRTEAACASGAVAVTSCVDSIQAGCDVTLAVGAEVECTVGGKEGAEYMARACHYAAERALDEYIFPYLFAVRAKAYKAEFGGTDDDIAEVVLKAYANANLNPNAHMRATKLTKQDIDSDRNRFFLQDPELHEHIRLYDCTHFSDGASAIIIASEDGLAKLGIDKSTCTQIAGYGVATTALDGEKDPTRLRTVKKAATEAFANANLSPADLDVAEVHDCFAINELQMYEALGLADAGGALALIREGHTQRDGRIPVNTGGGLIGFGHPVGATGVKQIFEIYRQMKGQCGDYQLAIQPAVGASANMGGDDRTGVVVVQKNC